VTFKNIGDIRRIYVLLFPTQAMPADDLHLNLNASCEPALKTERWILLPVMGKCHLARQIGCGNVASMAGI
jgi:hypothetical protein